MFQNGRDKARNPLLQNRGVRNVWSGVNGIGLKTFDDPAILLMEILVLLD